MEVHGDAHLLHPQRRRVGPTPHLVRLEHAEVSPPRASPVGEGVDALPLTHEHVPIRVGRALAAHATVRRQVAAARATRHEAGPLVAVPSLARRARVVAQLRREVLARVAVKAVTAHALAQQLVASAAPGTAAAAAGGGIVEALATHGDAGGCAHERGRGGLRERAADVGVETLRVGGRRERLPLLLAVQEHVRHRRWECSGEGVVVPCSVVEGDFGRPPHARAMHVEDVHRRVLRWRSADEREHDHRHRDAREQRGFHAVGGSARWFRIPAQV